MHNIFIIAGLLVPLTVSSFAEETSAKASDAGWENGVDLGFSLSKGNTDSTLLRFGIQTQKKDEQDAYFGSFAYTYGEEDGDANENEFLAKATWKHVIKGKNFFGFRMDARHDEFAEIDYRISLNATYGYYWIDNDTTVFSTEFGVGFTTEDVDGESDTYLNGLFDQHFSHEFNDHAKFYQNLDFAPRIDHLDDYRITFEMGFETKITRTVAFKLSCENRYESMPAEAAEKNDLKLVTGLSYKF